jgi:hypothetical protein
MDLPVSQNSETMLSRLRSRLFPPPADLYLRVDRVDGLLEALHAVQRNAELCEQRMAACDRRLDALAQAVQDTIVPAMRSIEAELASLKTMLQRFSVGSPDMVPRELAEAVAFRGIYANPLYRAFAGTDRPLSSVPMPVPFTSTLCHQQHFLLDQYRFWCNAMRWRPRFHRKNWEWFYIAQTLFERGFLTCGKRGIGFGVGGEPLPALFASLGAQIVATDQSPETGMDAGWASSCLSGLNQQDICPEHTFSRLVTFREVNMNDIDADLSGQFDFCWSSCALEHLGSLQHGLDFYPSPARTGS